MEVDWRKKIEREQKMCVTFSVCVCVVCLRIHGQGQRAFFINGELHDDQRVAGLPLLEGRVHC